MVDIALTDTLTEQMKYYFADTQRSRIIDRVVFDPPIPSDQHKYVVAISDGVVVGVLTYEQEVISKTHPQVSEILHIQVDSPALIKQLVGQLTDEVILTRPISRRSTEIISTLKQDGFTIASTLFTDGLPNILKKCKPDPRVEIVRYSKSNRMTYRRLIMDLVIDYDTQLAINRNKVIGSDIYNIQPKRDVDYIAKLTRFTLDSAYRHNWNTFLIFKDKLPIGFIRGVVDRTTHMCIPDLYLRPGNYTEHAVGAYHTLLTSLHRSFVRYIGVELIPTFRDTEVITRLIPSSAGVSMVRNT